MATYCEDHPEHIIVRGWGIVVAAAILGLVSTIVVSARLWLRVFIQKNVDASDWFMLAGLGLTLAYMVEVCYAEKVSGFDHHICDLTGEQILTLLKHTFSVTLLALCASFTIKASILLFYRRIARSHPSRAFVYINSTVFIFLTLQFFAAVIALFCACIPFEAFWNAYNPYWAEKNEFHCFNKGVFIISFGAVNVLLDIIITLLPTAMIWHIQLPRVQKAALWLLFSVGLLSTVAAVMRMYWGYRDFLTPAGEDDFTWNSFGTYFWTVVEFPIAIICGSGPTLKALFKRFRDGDAKAVAARTGGMQHAAPALADLEMNGTVIQGYGRKTSDQLYTESPIALSASSSNPSKHPSTSTASASAEEAEIKSEIRRLKMKNQGWGPYKTTNYSPSTSMEELREGRMAQERDAAGSVATGGLGIEGGGNGNGGWSATQEEEMGKMLDRAGALQLRSG